MRAACPSCETSGPPWAPAAPQLVSCDTCREAYVVAGNNGTPRVETIEQPTPLVKRVHPDSVMHGVLESLDDAIRNLPTIPVATQRVISAVHDPLTTTESLVKLINEDTTLSMRVLRLANSPVYGGRQTITDLRLACARLGTRNIANVAHVVAQAHLYRSANPTFRELMDQCWQHAVATARLTEAFGTAVAGGSPHGLFLLGLVHDVGKPVLIDAMSNHYKGRLGRLKDSPEVLLAALDDFAPHAGLRVAQHWNLPVEVRFATFYAAVPGAAPPIYRRHAYLAALSSAAADSAGYGPLRPGRDPKAEAVALGRELSEHLGKDAVHETIASVDDEIKLHLASDH